MVLYYPTIIGLVAALAIFYGLSWYKNMPQNIEFIGQVSLDSYRETQNSFRDMHYVKQSAKYSSYDALYPFAENGAYFNDSGCGYYNHQSERYTLWESSAISPETQLIEEKYCYPEERELAINLGLFLNKQLNRYLERYPSSIIPLDNYDFSFNENENTTEIIGTASQNIISSEKQYSVYSIKPSFTYEISYNFIKRFNVSVEKAKEIRENIIVCLKDGSNSLDDEDLTACSEKQRLMQEIEGIESYEITPVLPLMDAPRIPGQDSPSYLNKLYTILFSIKDDSFKSPYSDEKLVIKSGISLTDKFPPPPTVISGVETRTYDGEDITFLIWDKNYASDTESYEIYYLKIEDKLGGGEIPENPPTDIGKMSRIIPEETAAVGNEIEWEIDYTALEKGWKYYFYIRAKDDAGNYAENIDIEPTRLII
ncbi:hypothetical protein KY366_01250 [Candidatus Woesearchaeota archaeon]|nr:hypothetical protein [Candidatus Woesearchaeota archaeon]